MIDHIDHIVLTTRDKPACIRFYTEVLDMKLVTFKTPSEERLAFAFGEQKINLHEWGREFKPHAHLPVPGALDLCRSEEHTSELQSQSNLVCRLLLEKKKKKQRKRLAAYIS